MYLTYFSSLSINNQGCHGWRDMNQDDLTEAGMKQGVLDSEVFILFLTNAVLTRPFCLKEIGWALEAEKPIVIVAEEEERFWPFSLERWENDECTKDTTQWPHVWNKSEGLSSDYASCPANIKAEIHRQHEAGLILPYRRRDFEANAMILQVLAKAGELGCKWAKHVPKDALSSGENNSSSNGTRKLILICDTSEEAGASTMELRQDMNNELKQTLAQCNVEIVDDVEEATHALVVLTVGLLRDGSLLMTQLDDIVNKLSPSEIVYTYSMDAGWDFGAFYGRPASKLKASIAEHEALVYRPNDLARGYEHTSMVSEILRRLRPKGGSGSTDSSTVSSSSSNLVNETKIEEKKEEIVSSEIKVNITTDVVQVDEKQQTLSKENEMLKQKVLALEKENASLKKELGREENELKTWKDYILHICRDGQLRTAREIFNVINNMDKKPFPPEAKTPASTCSANCGTLFTKNKLCKTNDSPIKYFILLP